jgi:hypothetical protein
MKYLLIIIVLISLILTKDDFSSLEDELNEFTKETSIYTNKKQFYKLKGATNHT